MNSNVSGPRPLSRRRVLIVEDDVLIALHIGECLRELGCLVVGPLGDVGEALRSIETRPPDAAMIDAGVRGGSVQPLIDALHTRAIPFLLCTGYHPDDLPEIDCRGAAVLQEPMGEAVLRQAIGKLLTVTTL